MNSIHYLDKNKTAGNGLTSRCLTVGYICWRRDISFIFTESCICYTMERFNMSWYPSTCHGTI